MTASWAEALQRFSSPWLDTLVYYITSLGSEWFYLVLIPLLYWTWSKRAAYRIAVIFLFGEWAKNGLKTAFHTPRPGPTSGAVIMHPETGPGYSFPSGHAEGSTVFWGQAAFEVRKRWIYVLAPIVIFLVSLSRIYMNLHWPTDILGGFLLGVVLLVVFNAGSAIYSNLELPLWVRALFIVLIPVLMYFVYSGDDSHIVIGFMLGLPLGYLLDERYIGWSERASPFCNVAKVLLGFAGIVVIRFGLKMVFPQTAVADIVRYALAGFWASFLAPLLFVALGWQD